MGDISVRLGRVTALKFVQSSVVWSVLGLSLWVVACGGTSKKPPGAAPACAAENCPEQCEPSGKFCFERAGVEVRR